LFFAVAFLFLIVGAIANHAHSHANVTCEQLKSAVFAVGAAFTFLTMLMSILYYVLISTASISALPYGAGRPAYGGHGNPPSVGLATYA
jgi:Na+-driven multidrug efflux pump